MKSGNYLHIMDRVLKMPRLHYNAISQRFFYRVAGQKLYGIIDCNRLLPAVKPKKHIDYFIRHRCIKLHVF